MGEEASNACPASEWYAVRDYLSDMKNSFPRSIEDRYKVAIGLYDPLFHGQNSARYMQRATVTNGVLWPKTTTIQQAVVTDALTEAGGLWFLSLTNVTADTGHGSPLSDQSNAAHTVETNYSQPYAAAICYPKRIEAGSENESVRIPIFTYMLNQTNAGTQYQDSPFGNIPVNYHPDISYSQLLNASGNTQDYRLQWIELPDSLFKGSSIGAAVLYPSSGPGNDQDLILCNIAAAWGPSSLTVKIGYPSTESVQSEFRHNDESQKPEPIGQNNVPSAQQNPPAFGDGSYLQSPQGSINISSTWAEYLNPSVEMLNTSLFSALMEFTVLPKSEPSAAETIFSLLAVNGLARTGWGSGLQGNIRTTSDGQLDGNYWLSGKGDVFEIDPAESQDWVTLRMDSTLEGYAYNTLTTPPRIAIAILTMYCVLALGHFLFSGITGISSNCWDTIAEVVALAINSTPTTALRNTCAGISELHIFKLPVRVLVSKDVEGEGEHLELVFGEMKEEELKGRMIKENRTYGTLPKGADREGKKDV